MIVGAELWRHFVRSVPDETTVPIALIHVARLDPYPLECLMTEVIEDTNRARIQVRRLIQESEPPAE